MLYCQEKKKPISCGQALTRNSRLDWQSVCVKGRKKKKKKKKLTTCTAPVKKFGSLKLGSLSPRYAFVTRQNESHTKTTPGGFRKKEKEKENHSCYKTNENKTLPPHKKRFHHHTPKVYSIQIPHLSVFRKDGSVLLHESSHSTGSRFCIMRKPFGRWPFLHRVPCLRI